MKLNVNLGKDSYPIYIEQGILNKAKELISQVFTGAKIVIVSDDNVFPLYGEQLVNQLKDSYEVSTVVIPHGETSKRFDILPSIYSQLLEAKITRTDLLIALGGGVIGDLAGFVASTYMRGIKFVQIPTSLLSQVDSSVGGKVAGDLPEGKNLVGAFKHPLLVLIDPLTLKTLDPHFITDGMGEVIKYGCIKDKALFDQLAHYKDFDDLYKDIDEIIYKCVDIKRDVVEKYLYDFGDRLCLIFGHTICHSIEQHFLYDKYSHGLCEKGTTKRIEDALGLYNLPTQANVPTKELLKAIDLDKKNINSTLSFVLLKTIGEYYVHKDQKEMILEVEDI